MGKLNVDPITTFPDGSHLLISTEYSKDGSFTCGLYVATVGEEERLHLRMVTEHLAASTCLEAQQLAYGYAQRLYPGTAEGMKKPPYLVWQGPARQT